MPTLTVKSVALIGAPLLLIAALLGYPFTVFGLMGSAMTAVVAIFIGVKRYRPKSSAMWKFFGVAMLVFFLSFALRMAFPTLWSLPSEVPTAADFMDLSAYAVMLLGAHRLGKVRDRYKDPTTVIDALILTGGVSAVVWIAVLMPYVGDADMPASAKTIGVIASTFTLWLVFIMARVALGPGLRSGATIPLGLAAISALASQALSSMGQGTAGTPSVFAGSLALLCIALTALHPSMHRLTEPATQKIGSMSWKRLAIMTAAILAAPIILLAEIIAEQHNVAFYSGLIFSWGVVTTLVMLRLAGLVKARERVARTERALRQAAAKLVAARDRDETYEAALAAMFDVAHGAAKLRASFAVAGDQSWNVVASSGFQAFEAHGRAIDAAFMTAMLESNDGGAVQLDDSLALDAPRSGASCTLVVPLLSRGHTRGAMLLSSELPLSEFVVDAIESLASDVSMAIEAIGLAEDLHRRRSEQRFQALVQHSSEVTAVLDQSGCITYISPSAQSVLRRSASSLIGTLLSSLSHPDDRSVIDELVLLLGADADSSKRAEFRIAGERETWRTLEVVITDLRQEPSVAGIVLNAHDITERKALEEDLRHKVLHDDLTGIANRVLFRERVAHALASRQRFESVTAVLHLDLDDFKTINDGLGPDIGDELLKVIAFRLQSFVRSGDTAARLGGDEFAVLLENLYSSEDVTNACRRLIEVIQQPVQFGTREINVSVSIGVALANEKSTADIITRNADVALHHAKRDGKAGVRLFNEEMYKSAFDRLELKADLQHALSREELILHYQPLVCLQSGELLGFEALIRWLHPSRGMVSPVSFIPLAEETGLIIPIGEWVMETAMRQLARWRSETPGSSLGMSINLAPRQLENESIVEQVAGCIHRSGVAPHWITLELTESSGLDDRQCQDRLISLRALGCEIAADDFGTGFASYAALQQLPFTNVKIDRSLITGLSSDDSRSQAQVRSIIEMGHATGLSVTAEGIEEDDQRLLLAEMGADKGQGYLFSKPTTAKEAGVLVAQMPKRRTPTPS